MTIEKTLTGETLILKVIGRLDTSTAPQLEAEMNDSLDSAKDLILDFSELEYISSAGLRVILKAQKIMNKQGTMKLTGVNDTVMEVFDITGFSDILTFA
ncbi:MAG: STAS domain-containing protein [Oliverpabstia sp.]|nr:STAS domain-containing protein [Eubacterium sp.]MDY2595518.1 STAS domain-containing protein [Oliverpabstia sp.]